MMRDGSLLVALLVAARCKKKRRESFSLSLPAPAKNMRTLNTFDWLITTLGERVYEHILHTIDWGTLIHSLYISYIYS